MVDNPVWEICERVAEVQALLDDPLAGGVRCRLLSAEHAAGIKPDLLSA